MKNSIFFVIVIFTLVACQSSDYVQKPSAPGVQMPNPIIMYETAEGALENVSFDAKLIGNIPVGYVFDSASVIDDDLLQITFLDRKSTIAYRTAETTDDITGVYIEFPDKAIISVNGIDVSILSTGDQVNLATWNNKGIQYSLFCTYADDSRIDIAAIKLMVLSVM